jgi:hypothetical protein
MAAGKGTPARIEVEGAPQLRRAFKKMGGRASDLSAIHDDIAGIVADRAEHTVPRLEGDLASTIRGTRTATRARVEAGGRGLEPYAGVIHFGWRDRNIEPQPFLYEALDDSQGRIIKAYNDGIDALVHRFDVEAPD